MTELRAHLGTLWARRIVSVRFLDRVGRTRLVPASVGRSRSVRVRQASLSPGILTGGPVVTRPQSALEPDRPSVLLAVQVVLDVSGTKTELADGGASLPVYLVSVPVVLEAQPVQNLLQLTRTDNTAAPGSLADGWTHSTNRFSRLSSCWTLNRMGSIVAARPGP